jgi:hypothetical protein
VAYRQALQAALIFAGEHTGAHSPSASVSVSVVNDSASASVSDALLLPPPNSLAPSPDRRRLRGDGGALDRERDDDLEGFRSGSMRTYTELKE